MFYSGKHRTINNYYSTLFYSGTMFMIFFQFWPFNKSYYRNDLTKTLFSVLALLVTPNIVVWFWTGSRQTPQRDSWPRRHWLSRQFGRSRHVFRYQKWVTPCWLAWLQYELRHLSWRDSFWVKISMFFLLFNIFYN
jgi:hypothetical protein